MLAWNLPSLTAMFVAAARGSVTDWRPGGAGEAVDPRAAALLPRPARALVAAARRVEKGARALSLGLLDHVALRTTAIDAAIASAAARGVLQVVVLGAGLDARAFRMGELSDASVFEVDHPTMQAMKRRRASGLRLACRELRYVPVDFEREPLGGRLEEEGHDAGSSTFWVWEGVTMYLSREAARRTLEEVASRSAPGSELAMTYALPSLAGVRAAPFLRPLVHPAFALIGEPLRGTMSSGEASRLVREAGFSPRSDTGASEWALASGAPRPRLVVDERLLLASRRPLAPDST